MSLTLCVLVWAHEACESDLVEYEDRVLRFLPDHGGRVLHRARTDGSPGEPLEVQLLELPSEAALHEYISDERRMMLADARDHSIARTQVLRVDLVSLGDEH